MNKIIEEYSSYVYAMLRIVTGLMFMNHGLQKLFGIPGDKPAVSLFSLMGAAGIIELGCGLLIALGLLASYAAFLASGQMAAAYFMAHFPRGFLPILNGGELAVIYCFLFLYIFTQGSGICSIEMTINAIFRHPVVSKMRQEILTLSQI